MIAGLPRACGLVIALALPTLPACDTSPGGCFDRGEETIRIDALATEGEVPRDGQHVGRFTVFTPDRALFLTTVGEELGFAFDLEADALLPDLGAAPGLLALTTMGFVGTSTEPSAPVLLVRSAGARGRVLAALGNAEYAASDVPISVVSPRDQDTCAAYGHNRGVARNKPVTITVGDEEAVLFQGEEATLGGLLARVHAGQSNNRAHPSAPCSTADCPWEKLSWSLRDPELPELAPVIPPGESS